jgi:RND family efflux transporter MFP subunit
MEQQWKINMLLHQISKRTMAERLRIPGQIEAAQGAWAAVSPPVAGRLVRVPGHGLPKIGESVHAGDTLAFIEPPLPVSAELTLRALDLDMKAIEIERTISETRQRLEFAARAHDRAVKVRDQGVGTEQQYDEAKRNLELAQIEFDGALAMKRYYEGATAKLSELRGGAAVPEGAHRAAPSALQMPLVSPITGRIETAEHIEGEHVDAHQEVFRIVNTDHVWVEGRISEFDLAKLAVGVGAYMTLPSLPDRRIDILGSAGGKLVAAGQVVDSVSRTVPVRYELPNADGLLRIGMLADLFLETNRAVEAVAIPEEALVMEHGRPTAYILVHGELFQKRELELGIRDSGFVEVKKGLNAEERVATKGAFAIKMAALSPASFGAGHAH